MPNYRSLAGGFFSSTPTDKSSGPVSIRMNNPGAVNGAKWERTYPGYVTEIETTPGNKSTVFEAPEYGVAAWYELMCKYRDAGAKTLAQIINRYGGGQDYSGYVAQVVNWSALDPNIEIRLDGDDPVLLRFAKAMFRYEAGKPTPLSDAQILYGFSLARTHRKGQPLPSTPVPVPAPMSAPQPLPSSRTLWQFFIDVWSALIGKEPVAQKPESTPTLPPSINPTPKPLLVLPLWYKLADKEIGFHEKGVNLGIEKYLEAAKTGELGDPYCAIFINAMLENAGIKGSRSAAARSFETNKDFIRITNDPPTGAIVTMWRGSLSAGTGHVFLADGIRSDGWVRGIGGNENDGVRRSFHDPSRIVGYFWPKSAPIPVGKIPLVADTDDAVSKET